jgi:hypothetical protein
VTVNAQPPNLPFEPTVQLPVNTTDALPEIVNERETPGVKPPPEAVTPTPLGPRSGVSVSSGDVTLKFADAASAPPSDPVAVMV